MKIYDITQELFHSKVFPGDPAPAFERLCSISKGDPCNLTSFSMCAHNGTHVDAPYHFVEEGKKIDEVDLSSFVGEATVVSLEGEVSAAQIRQIMSREDCHKRLLLKGKLALTLEAAEEMNRQGILLYGGESQTVGPEDAPAMVHRELLGRGVVLLEGVVLSEVPDGNYLLCAAPLNLGGAEGAPCRAILLAGI